MPERDTHCASGGWVGVATSRLNNWIPVLERGNDEGEGARVN